MRNFSIATVISLSTLAFSQPVKADPNLSYTSAYKFISTSNHLKDQEFRVYILKWLEQDKGYPYEAAMSFCESRRQRRSTSQFMEMSRGQLMQRKVLEGWSESRFEAYLEINLAGAISGIEHQYCPNPSRN